VKLDGRALTFDCYGTLVDWNRGAREAIASLPSLAGCDVGGLLAARHRAERAIEAGPFRPYADVLARSLAAAAREQNREPTDAELERFAGSVPDWPPFDETPGALARLATRFRLAILSNVDTAPLRATALRLGAPFAALVTAEEVRSYKPARAHFDEALRRLELEREDVLHVAQSVYHDVRPTRALGWRCVWVDREGERAAVRFASEDEAPTRVVATLGELCDALGC